MTETENARQRTGQETVKNLPKSRNQKNKNAKLYSFEEEPENRVRILRKLNQNGRERDRNGASRFLKGSRPTPGSGFDQIHCRLAGSNRRGSCRFCTVAGLTVFAPPWVRDPRVTLLHGSRRFCNAVGLLSLFLLLSAFSFLHLVHLVVV
jgi:hypothetical protein